MGINNSQNAQFGTEMSAAMTGAVTLIGTLPVNPTIMIFDNQGSAAVGIYVNGTAAANLWRTFPAGEAITLDFRANHGIAANYRPSIGDTFFGNGASGTFSISYLYAENM